MFDDQTPTIALFALAAILLSTTFPAALIEGHTGRRTWLSRRAHFTPTPGAASALWVELPFVVILIGGSQIVMLIIALSPTSVSATRGIAAIEFAAFLAWMVHLIKVNRGDQPGERRPPRP